MSRSKWHSLSYVCVCHLFNFWEGQDNHSFPRGSFTRKIKHHSFPWLLLLPRAMQMSGIWSAMLVSKRHATTGVILMWMTWASTGVMVTCWPRQLPRTMCGSTFLLQLQSVLMSMFCVTRGDCQNHVWWNVRTTLSQPHAIAPYYAG